MEVENNDFSLNGANPKCSLSSEYLSKTEMVNKVTSIKDSKKRINIFNQLGVASTIIKYLSPHEAIDFLSIHPKLYFSSNNGWIILKIQCQLQPYEFCYISSYMTRIILESVSSSSTEFASSKDSINTNESKAVQLMTESFQNYNLEKSDMYEAYNCDNDDHEEYNTDERSIHCKDISYYSRHLILHVVRKLGFICVRCSTPLDGTKGLFACTNLCRSCALRKFRRLNAPYVDGTIKFYLCGNESITSRGRAFLTTPYWVSIEIDDIRNKEEIIKRHGTVFELAQRIYEEKVKEFYKTTFININSIAIYHEFSIFFIFLRLFTYIYILSLIYAVYILYLL